MTLKRRRERDRPKAGPDALYNPNKRVLLSYASDGDEEDVEDPTEQPHDAVMDERSIANYQMDEYPEDDGDEATIGAERPGEVEENAELYDEAAEQEEGEDEEEPPEQNKKSGASKKWGNSVKKNERTNQFPQLGLVSYQWDDEDEDEEYDSATEEAMAYLRGVRSERQGIPEVLTAPLHEVHEGASEIDPNDGNATKMDTSSHDGTWIAPASPAAAAAAEDDSSPQKVYTRNITDRFLDQRRQLRLPPTAEALADLEDSYPISFPQGNNKAYAEWHRLVSSKLPRLAQLQSLEQQTVFDLLEMVQTRILVPGKNIKKHVSNWIWSLLARLDEVGNMTNDQVYPLRELGKRAVFLQYSLTNREIAAQLEALGQVGSSTQNEDEIPLDDLEDDDQQSEIPATNAKEQTSTRTTPHPHITDNTLATLDMILVVVGEMFGQRDLLEFRSSWTAAATTTA